MPMQLLILKRQVPWILYGMHLQQLVAPVENRYWITCIVREPIELDKAKNQKKITVIRALNDLALASTASIPLTPPDTA